MRAGGDASEPRPARSLRRVLVVDDHDAVLDSLGMLVEALGFEVRTAADGAEAIAITSGFQPHVVLLDLSLRGMSGYEVARRIRSEPWGAGVTLVALTGWTDEEDRQRTREAGFDHHLVKPPRASDLQRILMG